MQPQKYSSKRATAKQGNDADPMPGENDDAPARLPRQRNQRGEGARLKSELLDAAMRILDRAPGSVLSLRLVAREAGVAAPSIYAHFADAQQLIAEIARECWQQLADEMAAAAQASTPGDPIGRIEAELGAYVRYATERPSRYRMLFAVPVANARAPSDLPALVQPAFRMVRDSLRALRDSGGTLPGSTSFEATLLLMSLVHGRIALASLAPKREGNSTAMLTDFVMNAINRLLAPTESGHARSMPPPAPARRRIGTRELPRKEEPR